METTFHDQSDSYLCHSYAIISAFRQVIRQFFSSPLAGSNPIKQTKFTKRINLMNKNFSFHRLLTAFVTGVNPRSFTGLITRQSANLETAVSRLVYRTAVEVEGWKKMIPVRDYFTSAGLQVKSFNSWYRKDFQYYSNYYYITLLVKEIKLNCLITNLLSRLTITG